MKKIKKSIIITLVGALTFGMVGCSSSKDTSSDNLTQLEQVKKNGTLVIATSADYPPYEFHKEIDGKDTIVGFEISMAEEIAKELGVKLEIKDMKFDGLLPALKSGNVDMVIAGMSPTEERKKAVNFTDVYYNGEHTVLIKKENANKYNSIEDLKNAKIGVQKSSLQEQVAVDVLKATNIKGLGKISDVVLELENGNVDAVVLSKETTKGYLKQYPNIVDANVDLGSNNTEGSAIAINKSEDNSLVEETNKIINKLVEENKINEFVEEATKLAQ